jgi:hypothetical protein
MKIKVGSVVKATHSFKKVRCIWKYEYPYKGDILTVTNIKKNYVRGHTFKLLSFKELPFTPALCYKTHKGKKNFKLIK